MKTRISNLLIVLLICLTAEAYSQFDPGKICHLDGDKLVFRLENQWTDSEKAEVSRIFDLDSLLLVKAFDGAPFVEIDSVVWQVNQIKKGIVEVSKMLASPPVQVQDINQFMAVSKPWFITPPVFDYSSESFGVNNLQDARAFHYAEGTATFFLPGREQSKKVFISGSFNNWSTMQSPMFRTDTGWIFKISLPPGRYTYKYIVDGKWIPDPSNRQKEDDTYNSYNSIVFCENHMFRLEGYTDAKKVILSGSFNNWNERELKMKKSGGKWELPVYLRTGTYSYKFIVDGNWMNDPANPDTRPDGRGNINSIMAMGDTTFIRLKGFKEAKKVFLAGSFNDWNPGELLMSRADEGWVIPYVIAPGNYEYKFVVDGKWIQDPGNPVSMSADGNSFMSIRPNHRFILGAYPDAAKVVVAGSFNGWNSEAFRMYKENGQWVFPLYLAPGKYTYKFIVDNNWILDPANELWEENEYGTNNSVIWINP